MGSTIYCLDDFAVSVHVHATVLKLQGNTRMKVFEMQSTHNTLKFSTLVSSTVKSNETLQIRHDNYKCTTKSFCFHNRVRYLLWPTLLQILECRGFQCKSFFLP